MYDPGQHQMFDKREYQKQGRRIDRKIAASGIHNNLLMLYPQMLSGDMKPIGSEE